LRTETTVKIAEKLMDSGNYAAVGISITSLMSDKPLDEYMFLSGIILWIGLFAMGVVMLELGGPRNESE